MGNKEIMDDEGISKILEEGFEPKKWERLLTYVFSRGKEGKDSKAHFDVSPDDVTVSSQLAKGAHRLGWITLAESKQIAVYKVELLGDVDIVRKRRGIRDMLNSDWHKGYEGAFIVSYPKGNKSVWRFSFVGKKDGGEETTATYLLGKGQECRTAAERFKKLHNSKQGLADVVEAFSVEALTKEFYKEIEDWFKWAKDKVEFPGHKYLEISKEEHQAKMTLRLITRLIFIWFLKEKGLVPKDLFDEDKIDELLNRKKFSDRSPYYRAILQNLFFATLNTPIDKREWLKVYECRGMNPKRGEQEYFRYWDFFKEEERKTFFISKERLSEEERKKSFEGKKELNRCGKIPFVNGGLFENLDGPDPDDDNQRVDCFSDRKSNLKPERLKVPDELFFGEKEEGEEERKEKKGKKKKGKKKKERKGIIDILKRYNFTLEENTPNDKEVALDPELLGCVFENLLAFVNPETSKPARNSSGSFYTPREIVDYMVSESLKAYLSTKVGDGECLEALFATKPSEEAKYKDNGKFKDAVAKALDEVKILDPACGSGAFPMGMLSKMIEILEKIGKIDPGNPKEIYEKKLQIIQDCIYGVDIQDIAVQISKLRFFISLLCDQVKDDKKDNYGIEALPNLETKIVCADTLISLPKSKHPELSLGDNKEIKDKENELHRVRRDYFRADSKEEKNELRRTDKATREELEKIITEFVKNNTRGLISKKKSEFAQCEEDLKLLKKRSEYKELSHEQPLLLVLGESESKKTQKKKNKNKIDTEEERLNGKLEQLKQEITELEEGIKDEGNKGKGKKNDDPTIKAAKLVAGWDPYNPSKREEFFSPEWMFGLIADGEHTRSHSDGGDSENGRVSEGVFDIVIGNPPYIRLEKLEEGTKTEYEKEKYETGGNIYCLFYERGLQLLKPGGHLCFITSNTWLRAAYGRAIGDFFAQNTDPKLIIDFAGVKLFKSATVDTNILLLSNSSNRGETLYISLRKQDKNRAKNLSAFVEEERKLGDKHHAFNVGDSWLVLSPIEKNIKTKIEKKGTPLEDWDIDIYRGVLTGHNDAFIISGEKRKEILANCKSSVEHENTRELMRKILKGRDIKRYAYKWDGKWLINTHNGIKDEKNYKPPINIEDYPAIKSHLDQYWERIEKREDQGDTPYNLRDCSYCEGFSKPKVIWKRVGSILRFSYDNKGLFGLDSTCFAFGENIEYLCCVLNSPMGHYLLKDAPRTGTGDLLISVQAVEPIRVPRIDEKTNNIFKKALNLLIENYNPEIEKEINDRIFDLYGLAKAERTHITDNFGYTPEEEADG